MAENPTKPTTPAQEGIDLHPDSWERFERTVEKVVKAGRPVHRTGKTVDANRHSKRTPRARAKPID